MQELETRGARQRPRGFVRAVLAAPQFISAPEVIKRTTTLSLRLPEETERAVGLVMSRLERAGAANGLDGLCGPLKRQQRDREAVVRGSIPGLGCDRLLEISEGRLMLSLRRNDHAEIMCDAWIARRMGERRAVGSFGIREPAG